MIIPYNHKRMEKVIAQLSYHEEEYLQAKTIQSQVNHSIAYGQTLDEFYNLRDAKQRFLNP